MGNSISHFKSLSIIMFKIKNLRKFKPTDQEWEEYFKLRITLKEKYNSQFHATSWQEVKKKLLSRLEMIEGYDFRFIYEDETIIGLILLDIDNYGKKNQSYYVDFDFLHEKIPVDLEKLITNEIVEYFKGYSVESFGMFIYDQRIETVIKKWDGDLQGYMNKFILLKENANRNNIINWTTKIPEQNPDLKIKFYAEIPDEYYQQHVDMLITSFEDMPSDKGSAFDFHTTVEEQKQIDEWRMKNDVMNYNMFLINADDQLIGFSTAQINLSIQSEANQLMTGVTRKYRGRGLSKWLKATMFEKLCEDFAGLEKVVTYMRAVNKPMQEVNEQMGFTFEEKGFEYKVFYNKLVEIIKN